jgi:hypothetical protein
VKRGFQQAENQEGGVYQGFSSCPQEKALVTTTIYIYLMVEGGELYERL